MGNGQTLNFTIYNATAEWNEVAGLYIFARQTNDNHWFALYVGQTNDFSARFSSHEKWNSAAQRGATHIHAVVVPLAANRDVLEKRLIAHLQPPLNEQHRGLRYQLMSV